MKYEIKVNTITKYNEIEFITVYADSDKEAEQKAKDKYLSDYCDEYTELLEFNVLNINKENDKAYNVIINFIDNSHINFLVQVKYTFDKEEIYKKIEKRVNEISEEYNLKIINWDYNEVNYNFYRTLII